MVSTVVAVAGITLLIVLRCRVNDDKQLIEAEDSWRLRDAGYNAIWASEVLLFVLIFSRSIKTLMMCASTTSG